MLLSSAKNRRAATKGVCFVVAAIFVVEGCSTDPAAEGGSGGAGSTHTGGTSGGAGAPPLGGDSPGDATSSGGQGGDPSVGGAPHSAGGADAVDGGSPGAGGQTAGGSGGIEATGGEASGGKAGVGGSDAGSGGLTGSSGGATGSGGSDPGPVNGCDDFLDQTADSASRVVPWGFGISSAPERCLRIRVGQTVTFEGSFSTHPLGGFGGDQPSPILGNYPSGATAYAVTFPATGTFGYECLIHSTMTGAIRVDP